MTDREDLAVFLKGCADTARRRGISPPYADRMEQAAAALSAMPDRQAGINEGLEMAAKACEAERLSEPQDESDAAYDSAIDHCIDAIRAMKVEK